MRYDGTTMTMTTERRRWRLRWGLGAALLAVGVLTPLAPAALGLVLALWAADLLAEEVALLRRQERRVR